MVDVVDDDVDILESLGELQAIPFDRSVLPNCF